jgi:hypothetical protein
MQKIEGKQKGTHGSFYCIFKLHEEENYIKCVWNHKWFGG